jgi:hypothetical protein
MPGKKENNDKNYLSRRNWMENKKKDRPKQHWITVNGTVCSGNERVPNLIPVHVYTGY